MVLLLDNRDSFVHNLARYVRELGGHTRVVRSDRISVQEIAELNPSHLIVSPGPCTPREAGVSSDAIRALSGVVPILGVCLGHLCVADAFGGVWASSPRPTHGRASLVRHSGEGILQGIRSPFSAGRYHSLVLGADALPAVLEPIAWSEEDEVMAVRHREQPTVGLQFHPESILTEGGHQIMGNFLRMGRLDSSPH